MDNAKGAAIWESMKRQSYDGTKKKTATDGAAIWENMKKQSYNGIDTSLQGTMGTRGVPTFNDIYKYIVQETRKGNWDTAQNTERKYWERMTDTERQKLNDYYKTTYGLVSAGAGESALTSQNVAMLPNATKKANDKEAEENAEWEQQKRNAKDKMNPLNFIKGLLLPDGKDGNMTLPLAIMQGVANPASGFRTALGLAFGKEAREGLRKLKTMEEAEANADDHSTDYGGQQGYELKQTADKAALDYEDSYQTVQVSAMQLRETEGQLETAKNEYMEAEQAYLNNPTQANYNAYKNALDKYNGLVTAYDTQAAKYNTDYTDYKTKADAAGVAVTAYNDHIAQWEKDLEIQLVAAKKEQETARGDVEAYGQLGYDSSGHTFTYASSEEALEALEVADKEVATLQGWKDTIDAQNTRKEFYAVQWESDFEKISAEGEADEGNIINRIALADPESKDGKAFLEFMSTYARYNHLTDTERKIYNYLYAKYGVVRANEEMEFLTEELNRRQGTADAKTDLQKNGVSRFLTGAEVAVESGLDRWAQGVKQAFTMDVLPQTATAYEYAARRDAAPNLGRAAMDITSMTTQQIPNMIIAAATAGLGSAAGLSAKAVGYISKGATAANTWISSGGNAYAAARREGKSETEARNYAIMVGGLEATLQYALSGVSKVGGQLSGHAIKSFTKNINNVYLQLGARLGLSMLSEGTEEYLQEILEPVVRNIAFGENNEFKLYSNEALYAFALAAVSAGLLEGIDTSGRIIGYARTGKAVNRFSAMKAALVQEALKLSPNTEAYKLAKAISDGKTKATNHNMGELYYEAIRAGMDLNAVYKTVSEEAIKAVVEAQEATVDEANDAKKAASEETTEKAENSNRGIGETVGDTSSTASGPPSPQGEGVGAQQDIGLRSTLLEGTEYDTRAQGKDDPSQSRQSRDSSPLGESQDNPSVGEADSSLYTREPSNREEDEGLGRVEMVYDPELDAEIPTGITDPESLKNAAAELLERDAAEGQGAEKLQEVREGRLTQAAFDKWYDTRQEELLEAVRKNNPAAFGMKGAMNNGAEGKRVSDGSSQRHDGTGAGEQAGSVDGGTEQTAKASDQRGTADDRRSRAKDLRGQEVSPKSMGVKNGSNNRKLLIMPESMWDEEQRRVAAEIEKRTGKKPIFVIGAIELSTKKGIKTAKGVILGDGTIILRADHETVSVEQIAEHELFHDKSRHSLLTIPEITKRIREKFTEAEFQEVVKKYVNAYRGIIDIPKNADAKTVEAAWNKLYEEIFADAHAGINDFGAVTFADIVNEYVTEQESAGTEQTAAATERSTGPPDAMAVDGKTFSYDELTSLPPVEGPILNANDTVPLLPDGTADSAKIRQHIMSECETIQTNATSPTYVTEVPALDGWIELDKKGIEHGYQNALGRNRTKTKSKKQFNDALITAQAELAMVDVLRGAIEVNRLNGRGHPDIPYSSVLLGMVEIPTGPAAGYYAVRAVVNHRINQNPILTDYGVIGRLHAPKAKKMNVAYGQVAPKGTLPSQMRRSFVINVADLLLQVKDVFDDTLSDAVYQHFGMGRNQSPFANDLMFSIDVDEAVDMDEKTDSALNGDIVPEAERDMAEQAARAQGYPVVEGVQIVPNKTYVRCTDGGRNNYGLVIGKAEPDASGREQLWVMFKNKNENKSTTAAIALSDLHPVEAMYQPTSEELESLLASEPEEVLREEAPEDYYNTPELVEEDLSDRALNEESLVNSLPTFRETMVEEAPEDYYDADEAEDTEVLDVDRAVLPRNAKSAVLNAEKRLAEWMEERFSLPYKAAQKFLAERLQGLTEEVIRKGTAPDKLLEELFEEAWESGVVPDETYADYADIIPALRKTGIKIPENLREDAAKAMNYENYEQLRKGLWGNILLKKNGVSIDSVYQQLQGIWPEAFPDVGIDQMLVHMRDAIRKYRENGMSLDEKAALDGIPLDIAKREAFEQFRQEAQNLIASARLARGLTREHLAAKNIVLPTLEQIKEVRAKMPEARRKANKAWAQALLLTKADRQLVRSILRGDVDPEKLARTETEKAYLMKVVDGAREYEALCAWLREYKRMKQAKRNAEMDELLRNIMGWKDKKSGIAFGVDTPVRNTYAVTPDRETAERVMDRLHRKVRQAEAEIVRDMERYKERVRALKLSGKAAKGEKYSESAAVQICGEASYAISVLKGKKNKNAKVGGRRLTDWQALVQDVFRSSPSLDQKRVIAAAKVFRDIYDELFRRINDVRMENGYEPIDYRKGYFPHFQEDGRETFFEKASRILQDEDSAIRKAARLLKVEGAVSKLPTVLAGRTGMFRPGIRWFGHAQRRMGVDTVWDAVQGMERYLEGALNIIHLTDSIQDLRTFANRIRRHTTPEELQAQIDEIESNEELTEDEKLKKIEEVRKDGKYMLSNYAQHIDELANKLANKRSTGDREMEWLFGRDALYNGLAKANARFAANAVLGNISTAVSNVIVTATASGEIGAHRVIWGMYETARDHFKKLSGAERDGIGREVHGDFVDRSDFLTMRHGSDPLYLNTEGKAARIAGWLMENIDGFVADSLVRARYLENRQRGMSQELSLKEAGEWAASIMAARNKSDMPTIFHNQNPFFKMFTQFQLEVNNVWRHRFKDLPREAQERGKNYLGMLLLGFLYHYLFNDLAEKLIGRRPADDVFDLLNEFVGDLSGYQMPNMLDLGLEVISCTFIEHDWSEFDKVFMTEKETWGDAIVNLGTSAAEEIPFGGNLMGGGRIPVSGLIPDLGSIAKTVGSDKPTNKKWQSVTKELAQPLLYGLLPMGGAQVKKTVEGAAALARGGKYVLDSEGKNQLQYPVTLRSTLQALTFGPSATPGGREWIEGGFKSFSAAQTAAYERAVDAGIDRREAYDLVDQLRSVEKTELYSKAYLQRETLMNANIPDETKEEIYTAMISDEHGEKIAAFRSAGLDFDDFLEAYNAKAEIDDMDLPVSEKAREFSRWVNKQGYTDKQASAVKDTLVFYTMVSAEGGYYDKFVGAGVSDELAYKVAHSFDKLEPKAGETQVSDMQKYRAVVDSTDSISEQMKLLEQVMHPSTYKKLTVLSDYYVTPKVFVSAKEMLQKYDADGNGSPTQAEVQMCLNAMPHLSQEARAALWQVLTDSTSEKNNPYSKAVGKKILNAAK